MEPLSANTLRNYESSLSVIKKKTNLTTTDDLATNAKSVVSTLKTLYPNEGTRKAKITALLYLFRQEKLPVPPEYQAEFASLRTSTKKALESQTLPDNRRDAMLSWRDVQSLQTKAKQTLSSEDYLIYCLYTMTAPVRADYTGMPVIQYVSKTVRANTTTNYCVLHAKAGASFFIFNRYKTSSTYGQVKIQIPEPLAVIIKFLRSPGNLLLPSIDTPNALTKRVIHIFKQLSEKAMGISLLRHSYITHYLQTFRRLEDKKELARRMLHSRAIQETYAVADAIEDTE